MASQQAGGSFRSEGQFQLTSGCDHGLDGLAAVDAALFDPMKECGDPKKRNNNTRSPKGEQEFAAFAVNQQHPADGHNEIDCGEDNIGAVSPQVVQAGLDKDGGAIADDGCGAGGLGAGEDDTCQDKRDHIFAAPK